jgi:hypothetical protein
MIHGRRVKQQPEFCQEITNVHVPGLEPAYDHRHSPEGAFVPRKIWWILRRKL